MAQIKILFWFDVEDFINIESEEALLAILNLLDKRGIKGIFKLVGEKIRKLEEHQRTDIIERLKRHEIGYHTNFHSIHPVITEYLEPLGFRAGAEEFERREGSGFTDLQRIIDETVECYGQPGQAWAPQQYPVLHKWNIRAYMDVHDQVTFSGKPFWYGGLLNFTSLVGQMGLPLKDGALEKAKQKFDQLCDEQKEDDIGLISIVYHPTEFVFSKFWDGVNFANGHNPPASDWVKPPFRPKGDMQRYLEMVEEFVDYTLTKENVNYVGTAELVQLEKSVNRTLNKGEVLHLAEQTGSELNYQIFDRLALSASEVFWTFRQYVLGLPPNPELIYGPERDLSGDIEQEVKVADVLEALKGELSTVCGFKQLPDYFMISGIRVNPVDLTCTLAAIIREGLDADQTIRVINGRLAVADHASNTGEWAKHWEIFPRDLKVPNIVEQSRLQTWTLKPALF